MQAIIDTVLRNRVLANAFKNSPTRFRVVSFTSDWLFPTSESRAVVRALNMAGASVSFVEIASDKEETNRILGDLGLPVPRQQLARSPEGAERAAERRMEATARRMSEAVV